MGFKKVDVTTIPDRLWTLVAMPGDGKTEFSTQMKAALAVLDADRKFSGRQAAKVNGNAYVSDDPADSADPLKMAKVLEKLPSDTKTIVLDSLTAFLSPYVSDAMLKNSAGMNKNQVAAFKDKAMAMRHVQDALSATGKDILYIYHFRENRDARAKLEVSTSISATELARLRRSVNMELHIVRDGERRGIKVEWCQHGKDGMTLWDDSGYWKDMPEKIEAACYGDGPVEKGYPTKFSNPESAIAWAWDLSEQMRDEVGVGFFPDAVVSKNSYEKLKRELNPKSAQEMWTAWIAKVKAKKESIVIDKEE